MGSWCCENLRDCQAWRDEGLPLTTTSNEACKLYDATLRQLVSWIDCEQLGGLLASMEKMLNADPDSIISRSLALGMEALGTSRKLDEKFTGELDALVADAEQRGNEREQAHSRAARYFAQGNMTKACEEWERILAEYPTDLQAVNFSHAAYFFSGKTKQKLVTIESVIDKWNPHKQPCASYLYGMQAFALEENELYDKARVAANKALEFQRQDAWAIHALAHCHEMNGEYEQGIRFMEETKPDWTPCWMIACHNFWHTALFYLEKADYESVLAIYDDEIAKRAQSKMMLDLVDAASLLQRLEMEGATVGKERWQQLVPLVEPQLDTHVLAFNDAHISMILANGESDALKERHFESMSNFIGRGDKENENRQNTELVAQKACEAIADYKNGAYEQSFERFFPVHDQLRRIGGSNAQRDVFIQLLINAGLQSTKSEHKEKALEVLAERNRLKRNSLVSDRIVERHKEVGH